MKSTTTFSLDSIFSNTPFFPNLKLKTLILLSSILMMCSFVGWGQVSVTATVGTVGPTSYATLNGASGAFAAINAGTHKGVITITITSNYTEVAATGLNKSGLGSSSYTSITIRPSGDRVITGPAAANNGAIISLLGADNVTIDGDDPSTLGSRNLTIQSPTSTTATQAVIRLASNSTTGTDGADNNTVKNCIIIGSRSGATSTQVNYGIVMTDASTNATGAYSSINTTIENNDIRRCWRGIWANGASSTYPNTGLVIRNNIIGNATSADNVGSRGIYIINSATSGSGAIIRGNDVRVGDYTSGGGYSASIAGIEISSSNFGIIVDRNNIHDISQPTASSWGSYGIIISGSTNNSSSTISNNFITAVSMVAYLVSSTSTYIPAGVYFTAGATNVSFVGNTIVMNAQLASGNFSSYCVNSSVSGVTFSSFQNNILVNNHSSNAAYCFWTAATTNISGGTVNNNCYFAPNGSANVGYYNAANRTTLSDWQTATSKDANAISVNPPFVSATDLHINGSVATLLESGGTTTSYNTDIDGQTRPGPSGSTNGGAIRFDIGADEFDGVPVICSTPTSLAATVSSSTQTFTSISGSFTAASVAPTGYLVIRTATNTQPTPANYTTYTTGSNAIGFIEYVGTSAGNWTSSSLTNGTTYYYWVFSYNNTPGTCLGPIYSASAATLAQSTAVCSGAALANLSYGSAAASYCTANVISTNVAALGTSSGTPQYSVSPSLPTGLTISSSTGNITGTPTTAQTSTPYTVTADNGCTSTTATVNIEIVTSPTAPTSVAASSPTYSGFTANWTTNGAASYQLDVATDASFTNLVSGYNALNVGSTSPYAVTGLNAGATYYYRVRSVSGSCVSANSASQTATTTAITSLASGNWNATTTWNSGTVPICGDVVNIANTHNVTVNSSSNVSGAVTIASGGTLTIASGDLTVGCTLNNTPLTNNGTLTVTGGSLNVNGNIVCSSTFNQSGGTITIDGNNGGNTTGSVAAGTAMLSITSSALNLTGGTIVIVDPNAGSSGLAFDYSNGTHYNMPVGSSHTFQFGNGVSTDATSYTAGFRHSTYTGSGRFMFQNVVLNTIGTGNRTILTNSWSHGINGNLTITNGDYQLSSALTLAGNLINNGILSATSTLSLATFVSGTAAASSIAQTISGSGTFRNATTSPTASMSGLTINNTSSSGVTLSTPLSISGTLTMTAGKINTTATNLLTLGTTTAAGTLTYTAGQIVGPFARTFAASRTATGTYDVTTLFPVGDGTTYLPINIDPTTTASGAVVMRGQAFNSNSGTGGSGVASQLSSDRWEALATSGSSNLTNCFIRLNDTQIASGNVIAQSSSASGTYTSISPSSTVAAGSSITTATAISAANYTGYFTYAAAGPAITSFTPTSVCPNAVATITVTGTNLGSATSVTLNGESCTITNNTTTSVTFTTDATPQAGNIVVTTAANNATSATALSLYTLPTVTASSNASNNTICSGTSVTLNGGGASTYTWNNGVSNNTSFTPISTSSYTVTGTDANGCTNTASLTVTVNNAVNITSQPVNAVVLPNTNATFSVTATGTSLTYQWEENTGSAWSAISNGGIYSGATSNTLTLTGVSSSESGYQYRCIISGTTPCVAATTSVVTLTISSTAITAQPQNQSICLSSGTASFSVSTTGSTPTYQWQLSTNSGTSWADITGEISASLSLSNLTLTESGNLYRCVLNGNITSSSASLTVSPVSVAGTVSSDQAICSGSTPSSITLSGNTGSIQWQVSSDNSTFNDISGATSSTLGASTIGALTSTRYYRAVVTSGGCTAANSSAVTVTVTPTPNAGTLSGTQTVCANATTTFSSNGDTGGTWSSATTATATVNSSTGVITGVAAGTTTITYTITGTGGCSNATATRTVTVNAVPPITSATATPSTVCAGSTISLSAGSVSVATGTANVGVQSSTTLTGGPYRGGSCTANKVQYLITAAELTNAGVVSGNINSLTFVTTSTGSSLPNFTISIANTSLTSMSSTMESNGFTQVFSASSYTPTSGNNLHTFSTPFNWNGSSNIIINVCHDYACSSSATMSMSSPGYAATTYLTTGSSGSNCSTLTGGTTATTRPVMIFNCQVGTNNAANYTWSWNSTPTVSAATGTTTAVNNTSTAATQTYTVTATVAATGCSSTATTSAVTINPLPSAPTATNSSQCGVGIPTGTVASTSGASSPNLNWYTAASNGSLVLTSYTGVLSNYYSNDFSSNSGTGVVTGNASVTGGVLELTPNLGSQLGAITIPASGISADKYKVSFNVITSSVAQTGADGLSYSFGDDVSGTSTTVSAETGSGSKLKVSFDAYGTSGNGISGIRVIYGSTISDPGTTVGTNGILAYSTSTAFAGGNIPVIIEINSQGQLTLTVNGTAIFTNLQLPAGYLSADKSNWLHGFKARTGGVFMTQSIDNLTIQQSSYAAATSYPNSISSTTTYYVIESLASGCVNATPTPITFTINTPPSITASAASGSVCLGQSTTLSATSSNSGYTYSWNNSAGSGTSVSVSPTSTTTYTVTGTDASGGASNGCSSTATVSVTVNPLPTTPTITPSSATICNGAIQTLTASGGLETVYQNDFESGVTGFTPSASATATSNTTYYAAGSKSVLFNTSATSNQYLTYDNVFNLANASSVQLSFKHIAAMEGASTSYDYGLVEYSADGGTTWTSFVPADYVGSASTTPFNTNVRFTTKSYPDWISTLTSSTALPNNSLWKTESFNIPSAALTSQFKIRFRYNPDASTFYYGWLIDDILLTKASSITWSPTTALYTNSAATTAYTGTSAATVYAQSSTTTTYTATATSSAGCTASTTATITVNQPTITWTGATSSDPTDASNWTPAGLPCTVAAITIPVVNTNYPSYTNLTISSGGSLTLQSGAQLTVTGVLTNNGTMTIESGATFKQGTSVAGTGTYNVQQALDNCAGSGSTLTGRYWYLGSPVSCTRSSSFGSASALNKVWSFTNGAYGSVADATTLSPTSGYVHRRSDNATLTFTGTNLYAQDATLSLSNNAGTYAGWHLVSNPYTAYLDWVQMYNASSNISASYYIRSYNTTGNDVDALITYSASTGLQANTSSYNLGSVGATTAQYIAPMQAIWVKVLGSTSTVGSLSLNRNYTSHQTGGLKSSTIFPTLARVNLVNGARFDQMLVYMNPDMTNGVDQYDSEKMFVSGASQIYTMAAGKKLVMNGLKNNKSKISVPVYLELPESKVYQLSLAEYILEDGIILLEDKQEGTIQDFTIHDVYSFYATSGVLSNRFVLHFFMPDNGITAQGPSNNWVEEEAVINEGGNILVNSDGRGKVTIHQDIDPSPSAKGNVVVRDAAGREVWKGQLNGSATTLELDTPSGIYFVEVELNGQVEMKKIFVQQ